ncbi:Retrotransposon Gag-like protein 3 [Sporothrix epigloea]|uniref:Retrotransposon Gag-like protein 3 n=1 Tax=Sporothrix epigloea TaxID=1892477 RepID=A0ABP0E1W6_9PEZI
MATTKPAEEAKFVNPKPFNGRREYAIEFSTKCINSILFQPLRYSTGYLRINYVTGLLEGAAYQWVQPCMSGSLEERPAWLRNWEVFKAEFRKQFGNTNATETARHKLKYLKRTGFASTYITEFQLQAAYLSCYSALATAAIEYDELVSQGRTSLKRTAVHQPTARDTYRVYAVEMRYLYQRLSQEEFEYRIFAALLYMGVGAGDGGLGGATYGGLVYCGAFERLSS